MDLLRSEGRAQGPASPGDSRRHGGWKAGGGKEGRKEGKKKGRTEVIFIFILELKISGLRTLSGGLGFPGMGKWSS